MNRCPYCGRRTFKEACSYHRDLLVYDPAYGATAPETGDLEAALEDGSPDSARALRRDCGTAARPSGAASPAWRHDANRVQGRFVSRRDTESAP